MNNSSTFPSSPSPFKRGRLTKEESTKRALTFSLIVHLGLLAPCRRKQLVEIANYIERHIPLDAPLIIAGDFNDWSTRSGRVFAHRLKLHEVFEQHYGKPARSFPAWLPMLRMDRIYVRGFHIKHVEVHSGAHFLNLSDHAILTASLTKT